MAAKNISKTTRHNCAYCVVSISRGEATEPSQKRRNKISKYTTEQLKAAMIGLYGMKGDEASAAFEMTFDEVCGRIGDVAFDEWCEAQGW